jgi:ribosome-associated translation inhibitor RaiA
MNAYPQNLILTTDGFAARAELTTHAEAKVTKLLRHTHPRVHLVRVHVRLEKPHSGPAFFAARATAERAGSVHVMHGEAAEPETAITEAFDKLERALTAKAGARKHAQHHPHPVELAAQLPKAI